MNLANFDSRKYLYSFVIFLFSFFLLNSFQLTGLSNNLLRSFDGFWLCPADKVTGGLYNFVSLIMKIKLLELALTLSTPAANKTQNCAH